MVHGGSTPGVDVAVEVGFCRRHGSVVPSHPIRSGPVLWSRILVTVTVATHVTLPWYLAVPVQL